MSGGPPDASPAISRANSFYNISEAKDNNNGMDSSEDESSDDDSDDNESPTGTEDVLLSYS